MAGYRYANQSVCLIEKNKKKIGWCNLLVYLLLKIKIIKQKFDYKRL